MAGSDSLFGSMNRQCGGQAMSLWRSEDVEDVKGIECLLRKATGN